MTYTITFNEQGKICAAKTRYPTEACRELQKT